jgi:hypothetical protein
MTGLSLRCDSYSAIFCYDTSRKTCTITVQQVELFQYIMVLATR